MSTQLASSVWASWLCPSDGSPLRFPPRNLQRRRQKSWLADEAFGICAAGTGHETLAREQRSRESQTLFTYLDNISIRCRLDRKEPQTSSVIRDPPVCNSTMTIAALSSRLSLLNFHPGTRSRGPRCTPVTHTSRSRLLQKCVARRIGARKRGELTASLRNLLS